MYVLIEVSTQIQREVEAKQEVGTRVNYQVVVQEERTGIGKPWCIPVTFNMKSLLHRYFCQRAMNNDQWLSGEEPQILNSLRPQNQLAAG